MRAFTIRHGDIARCPKRSLSPSHYRDDGSCRCDHRPGRLRFCRHPDGGTTLCQDGYFEDRRHGLITLPRSFAEAGRCMYCGAPVPTNQQRGATDGQPA